VCEFDVNDESKIVDVDANDENEKQKHAELLALIHGAKVYVGAYLLMYLLKISYNYSEDLKQLFESVGS
jgi:glycerol dehydrogenase-like iron-containing ADH family enzyme